VKGLAWSKQPFYVFRSLVVASRYGIRTWPGVRVKIFNLSIISWTAKYRLQGTLIVISRGKMALQSGLRVFRERENSYCCAHICSIENEGISVKILQLDEIRRVLTPNPGTQMKRGISYIFACLYGKLLTECGINVLSTQTANRRRYRDAARSISRISQSVYKVPSWVCMEREATGKLFSPKGIYKKSKQDGANVPGSMFHYEEPLNPE